MSIVIVDRATSEKLRAAGGGVEIRDESGELIGSIEKPINRTDEKIGRQLPEDRQDATERK